MPSFTTSAFASAAAWISGSSRMRSGMNRTSGNRGRHHVQRLVADVQRTEQRRLDQLQVALVAGREFGGDAEHLDEAGLRGGRAPADQLEHVRVALLRHDRRAGREGVGQLHEAELTRIEEQQVRREATEVLHQQRDLEKRLRLGLAARELYRGDRLVVLRQVEPEPRAFAIDGKIGRAVAGGRTERVLQYPPVRVAQCVHVVEDLGGEAARPECDRTRHRLLHVRIAGDHDVALLDGQRLQRRRDAASVVGERLHRVPEVEPERDEHLVVAGPPDMQTLACGTDPACKQGLECRLAVFEIQRHGPFAACVRRADLGEPSADGVVRRGVQQPHVVQHPGVRDRRHHVVPDQAIVERVVLAGRESQHALVERRALVPEPRHQCAPCSAGLSALVSATTSVPVPSFVNTSASSASGAA